MSSRSLIYVLIKETPENLPYFIARSPPVGFECIDNADFFLRLDASLEERTQSKWQSHRRWPPPCIQVRRILKARAHRHPPTHPSQEQVSACQRTAKPSTTETSTAAGMRNSVVLASPSCSWRWSRMRRRRSRACPTSRRN